MRADNKHMSQAQILLRALPNVEFVHGFPGIPAGPDRPQATIRGALEVRIGNQAVKAKWVKVEFRKVETIPGGNGGEDFIDLIGQGPMTLWQAHDENDTLTTRDFPFSIRIPETIPPSVALERGGGIRYEVYATLCVKGKKGLFRREASSLTTNAVPVVIDKHELHSTWPIYAQPESRQILRDDGLVLIVDRGHTCFAPGDRLAVVTTLKSENLTPVVLRSFEFSLAEITTYNVASQSHGKKTTVQSPVVKIVGEQKLPVSLTLYGGTQHRTELGCMVPSNHTTSSITAGRHIDVSYKIRVKAILDHMPAMLMELPVTITNWPRNVSAEMTRRIGTAPNLSLKSAMSPSQPVGSLPLPIERLMHYPPQLPPPTGALPSVPNGHANVVPPPVPPKHDTITTSHGVPPGALVPGSTSYASGLSAMNPYSFQQSTSQSATTTAIEDQLSPLRSMTSSNEQPSTISETTGTTTTITAAGPDEFGYKRQPEFSSATAPARIGQRSTTQDSRTNGADFDTDYRRSQYSQDGDGSRSVAGPGSASRRTRAATRLTVMNVTDDIPEETSPVTQSSHAPLPSSTVQWAAPSLSGRWPAAEEEKQRLYENAKAEVQRATGSPKLVSEIPPPVDSRSSNGHISPPLTSNFSGRETYQNPSLPKASWVTAEQEKQRLFNHAQAQVKAHGLGPIGSTPSPPPPPVVAPIVAPTYAIKQTPRPAHNRTFSESTGSHEFSPAISQYTPGKSAGAALYSKAMSSITRASSATAVTPASPPMKTPQPRRNVSLTGSGSGSGPSNFATLKHEDDKHVLRYNAAKQAVDRHQLVAEGVIPDEAPIPYHQLFDGETAAGSSSGTHLGHNEQPLSEKEMLRRKNEAQDAAAVAAPPSIHTYSPAITQRSVSLRSIQGPPDETIPEKERMRRAFAERDAALLRAGQIPPPIMPEGPGVSRSPSAASYRYNASVTYDMQPPPPAWEEPRAGPLTASQEKAQLAKRYAQEDAASDPPPSLFPDHNDSTEQYLEQPESPTRERSFKSDSSEVFLRRDPTISQGKKRASQMIDLSRTPPPPLPPHPPQEYIEETQIQDRRATILNTLPPDFTSSFDIGFDSFGEDGAASGSPLPRPR